MGCEDMVGHHGHKQEGTILIKDLNESTRIGGDREGWSVC